MPDQVDEKIKARRSDILLTLEDVMSHAYRQSYVGREVEVLFETPWEWDGRSYYTGYTREYIRVAYPTNEDLSNQIKKGILGEQRIFIFCGNNTRERRRVLYKFVTIY